MLDQRHDEDRKNGLWDIIHWNAICGGLQASMPADHVFGLCGVANDVEEIGIHLDYNKEVADIYTEMASSCIKKKGLVVIADVQWPKKSGQPAVVGTRLVGAVEHSNTCRHLEFVWALAQLHAQVRRWQQR